jgi:hypothetical protein
MPSDHVGNSLQIGQAGKEEIQAKNGRNPVRI